ncbi:hypothetical protein NVP1111B_60 [Vibrio phage 1.111.B._10N.286.45.E6]|nr:hypothetical protein NVP1111A_60 [Vibrio phage 1.111.A._10N.286.45.E6]AUR88316.1 hypothetical protein NVP1111B_60 [Vibrio phage 1.111.B._10N.286.45.E6]
MTDISNSTNKPQGFGFVKRDKANSLASSLSSKAVNSDTSPKVDSAPKVFGPSDSIEDTSKHDSLEAIEVAKMKKHFSNYAYVLEAKIFIDLKTGRKLDKEQFNDSFCETFAKKIKPATETSPAKVIETVDASSAFIRSELSTIASNKKCFSMMIDRNYGHGEIVNKNGVDHVNVFRGLSVEPVEGDTSLFHDLMDRLFSCDSDKSMIIDYMAAMIQNAGGEKVKHGPFIQGTQGNGKSTIGKIVRNIIGMESCAIPSNNDLHEKYNGWALGKLFATVEEVKAKGYDTMDSIKTLITEDSISFRMMKSDSFLADNKCNFMFFSNHKDGVLIDKNERRYSVFFTDQQCVEDVARDFGGVVNSRDHNNQPGVRYFDKLYEWLNNGGYESICYELVNRDISGFSLLRAPHTSHLKEAIEHSRSNNEQIIQDGMESGAVYGEGRVVSLKQIDEFLKDSHVKMTPKQKRLSLNSLGFVDPDREEEKSTSNKGRLVGYDVGNKDLHRFMIHSTEVLSVRNGMNAKDLWKSLAPINFDNSMRLVK